MYNQGVGFWFATNFPMLPSHLLSVTHIPLIDHIYLISLGILGFDIRFTWFSVTSPTFPYFPTTCSAATHFLWWAL